MVYVRFKQPAAVSVRQSVDSHCSCSVQSTEAELCALCVMSHHRQACLLRRISLTPYEFNVIASYFSFVSPAPVGHINRGKQFSKAMSYKISDEWFSYFTIPHKTAMIVSYLRRSLVKILLKEFLLWFCMFIPSVYTLTSVPARYLSMHKVTQRAFFGQWPSHYCHQITRRFKWNVTTRGKSRWIRSMGLSL
jgi:hypothetical protein